MFFRKVRLDTKGPSHLAQAFQHLSGYPLSVVSPGVGFHVSLTASQYCGFVPPDAFFLWRSCHGAS